MLEFIGVRKGRRIPLVGNRYSLYHFFENKLTNVKFKYEVAPKYKI